MVQIFNIVNGRLIHEQFYCLENYFKAIHDLYQASFSWILSSLPAWITTNVAYFLGLGKLSPNLVLMGYKTDWQSDPSALEEYYNVVNHGFDLHLAMAILRLKNGCDFSDEISVEEDIVNQNNAQSEGNQN